MTNQQMFLAIGVPSLIAVFNTGLIITLLLHFVNKLDGRMDRLEARMDRLEGKIDHLAEDYTRFYGEQQRHDARLDALERQRPQT